MDWPHWQTPGHDMELCKTNNMTHQETVVCWVMGSYPVMKKVNGEQGFAVMDTAWCEEGKGVEMAVTMLQLSGCASCAVRCDPEWYKDQGTLEWYQQKVLGCLGHAHKQAKHLRVCAPPAESLAKFRKAFSRPSVGPPAVAVVAVACAAIATPDIALAAPSAAPRQVTVVPVPALPCLAPASVPVEVPAVVGAPVQVRTVAVPAAPVQVRTVAVLAAKKGTFVVKGPRTLVLPVVAPVCPASRMLMEGDFPSLKVRQERKNEPAAVATTVPSASVPYQLPAVALLPVAVVAVAPPYCSPACCCCCRC